MTDDYTPPALREQLSRLEAMEAQMLGQQGNTDQTPDTSNANTTDVVIEPEQQDIAAPVTASVLGENVDPMQESMRQPQADAGELERAQQAYRVINGKYVKEVPRYQAEIKAKDAELQALKNKLAEIEAQKPLRDRIALPAGTEEFDDEFVNMAAAVSDSVAKQHVEGLSKDLAQIRADMARASLDSFDARLSQSVPDFRTVHDTPEFQEWMQGEVPFVGRPYGEVLREAHEGGDHTTAAKIFNEFKKTQTPQKQHSIQNQIMPTSTARPVNNGISGKPTFTASQIVAMSTEITKTSSQAKREQIQKTIDDAMRDNRIRPG